MQKDKLLTQQGAHMFRLMASERDGIAANLIRGEGSDAKRSDTNDGTHDGGVASINNDFDVNRGIRNFIMDILERSKIYDFNPHECCVWLCIHAYVLIKLSKIDVDGEIMGESEYILWHIVGHQEGAFTKEKDGITAISYDVPAVQSIFNGVVGARGELPIPGGEFSFERREILCLSDSPNDTLTLYEQLTQHSPAQVAH